MAVHEQFERRLVALLEQSHEQLAIGNAGRLQEPVDVLAEQVHHKNSVTRWAKGDIHYFMWRR